MIQARRTLQLERMFSVSSIIHYFLILLPVSGDFTVSNVYFD